MAKSNRRRKPIYKWMEEQDYWVGFLSRGVRLIEIHRNYRAGGWWVSIIPDLGEKLFRESDFYSLYDSTIKAAKSRASKFAGKLPNLLHAKLLQKRKEVTDLAEFAAFVKAAIEEG